MKAYTDLEQSKRLAKILPIESADMRYAPFGDTHPWFCDDCLIEKGASPCWSLAALLNILPETIEDEWAEYDLQINMIYKKPEYVRLGDCHHSDFPSWDWDNEELLDNIVEAIIWLDDNNYL